MNRRIVGFVMVSGAVVAAILAFTFAKGYNGRLPLTWNLANAELISAYRTETIERPCPRPAGRDFRSAPPGCPITEAFWREGASYTYTESNRVQTVSVNLGLGLAIMVAVGLAGVGLISFGRS